MRWWGGGVSVLNLIVCFGRKKLFRQKFNFSVLNVWWRGRGPEKFGAGVCFWNLCDKQYLLSLNSSLNFGQTQTILLSANLKESPSGKVRHEDWIWGQVNERVATRCAESAKTFGSRKSNYCQSLFLVKGHIFISIIDKKKNISDEVAPSLKTLKSLSGMDGWMDGMDW